MTSAEEARAIADRILKRMLDDDGFRESVSTDPKGALVGAGVPEDEVAGFIDGLVSDEAEVEGHAASRGGVFAVSVVSAKPPLPSTYTEKCWCNLLFNSKPIVL